MLNRAKQLQTRSLRGSFLLLFLSAMILAPSVHLNADRLRSPNPAPTQLPERVLLQTEGATPEQAQALLLTFTMSSQGVWEQRFEKVRDALTLEASRDGNTWVTIWWKDRGCVFNDKQYTWCKDNPPETRSISPWVGNDFVIRLRAKVIKLSGPPEEKPFCYMDTLYSGDVKRRWSFEAFDEATINR